MERERELSELRDACVSAARGSGSAVLVQGPAGIGKTALLDAGAAAAQAAGLRVHRAAGTELERELAFGVARQLLEGELRAASGVRPEEGPAAYGARVLLAPDAGTPGPDTVHAALHGLFWLLAERAAAGPLALVIDDAHWADGPSLRWLAYVGRRLEGLPLLVLLARRPAEPGTPGELLDRVVAAVRPRLLEPAPLTAAGTARWLARDGAVEPSEEVVRACLTATGGNPQLLRELVTTLRAGPTDDVVDAARIAAVAPAGLARAVLLRLAPLGPDAAAVAEAVAVLSSDARLDRVAALAGMEPEHAARIVDALAAAGVLVAGGVPRFVHPILRAAIDEQVPPARRALAHLHAAALLREGGEEPERVAPHLLLAPPGDRAWVAATLREAADRALARGAPETAVTHLRRALAESPADRVEALLELAVAESVVQDPAAAAHAGEALELAAHPGQRARAALVAARTSMLADRMQEALALLDRVAADADALDEDAHRVLQAEALVLRVRSDGTAGLEERLAALGTGERPLAAHGEPILQTLHVVALVARGAPRAEVVAATRPVLEHLARDGSRDAHAVLFLTRSLAVVDELDAARDALTLLVEHGRERGSLAALAGGPGMRAEVELRAGRLEQAEADARDALAVALEHELDVVVDAALMVLAEVTLEREGASAALAFLDAHAVGQRALGVSYTSHALWHARGRARAQAGDLAGAVGDLRACGEERLRWGDTNPATLPWRSSLALALAARGEVAQAVALATEELQLARRCGAPRAIGIALRARALAARDDEELRGLRDAVDVLAGSPARLEHARALTDFGAALRRRGQRAAAREPLAEALELAHACSGSLLAARARAELVAAGARPRRERLRGPHALTASERRVAELAAAGQTNRQIAQALFITTKTVEMHLSRTYAKLGIRGRSALGEPLRAELEHGRDTADSGTLRRPRPDRQSTDGTRP